MKKQQLHVGAFFTLLSFRLNARAGRYHNDQDDRCLRTLWELVDGGELAVSAPA